MRVNSLIYVGAIFQVLPLRPGAFGLDDITGFGSRGTPRFGGLTAGLGGLTAGMNMKGYPTPLDDPAAISQRRDPSLVTPGIPDILPERSSLLRQADGPLSDESNILFVDGLPSDCTRREVARILMIFSLVAWFMMISPFWHVYRFVPSLLILDSYFKDLFRPFIGFKEIRVIHKEPRRVCLFI